MSEQPGYYAVIPATIRYSKELCPNAKLLYGEITALANKEGYCFASNQYFANLYDVSTRSIRSWIQQLKDMEFIFIAIETENERKIYLHPPRKKSSYPQEEIFTPLILKTIHNPLTLL